MKQINDILHQQQHMIHVMQIIFIIVGSIAVIIWTPLITIAIVEIYKDMFTYFKNLKKKKVR